MGTWLQRYVQGSVCVVLCFTAMPAQAGPVETLFMSVTHPTDPDVITLGYDNAGGGLIHTTDGGETWALGCHSALGVSRSAFAHAMDASGALHMAFFSTMMVDDTKRCAFEQVPEFEGRWVSDVTLHPDDPTVVIATTSGGTTDNGIYKRNASGVFELVGGLERVLIGRVRVIALPGGGERYYETIARGETMEMVDGFPVFFPNYFVRSSDDGAATWTEHSFPKTEGTLRLELIDPSEPNRVVVSVDNTGEGDTDAVLVSDDAGETFRMLAEPRELGGVTLSSDGRLWVGDGKGGLFVGELTGTALTLVNEEVRPTCVRFEPISERVYVCEDFGFGFYEEDTDSFVQIFDITKTEAFLDCSGVRDEVAECEDQMFAGFCGPTHYPGSQICWENYPDKVPQPTGGTGGASGSGAGGTGGASGSGAGGTGGTGGADGMPEGGSAGDGGADDDSGCAVSAGQSGRGGLSTLWLVAAAGLVLARLRRRHGRRAV